jgi:alkylation response protein AidB-like acyl-CoA dehydrogenase
VILDHFPAPTLAFGANAEALRGELRLWLSENAPGEPPENYKERIAAQVAWQAQLCAAGFVGLAWPTRYGGRGLGLDAEAVLAEELAGSDMPELINRIGVYMIGPTILDLSNEEHRARFLPGMLDASELWCQGFSEPNAGSDLAAIRTTAVQDGDDLLVNGQKVWTSRAGIARWCAALVRTDRDQARHRGLSMVIVDMRDPAVTVRPLPQILGEPHFSEVFFEDVRVPMGNVMGNLGEGWSVAMRMLSYERGLFVLERQIRLRRRLDEVARLVVAQGRAHDSSIRERIGRVHVDLQILEAQVYRSLAAQMAGTLRPGATSVDKLLMSHAYQELFALAADLLEPGAAVMKNEWTHDLLESRSTSIYGGTTEIQHGIVARQLLGLERAR